MLKDIKSIEETKFKENQLNLKSLYTNHKEIIFPQKTFESPLQFS